MSEWCLGAVWMMSEWCMNHVWMISCCHVDAVVIFCYLNDFWMMSECVWMMFGWCLNDVWTMAGWCPADILILLRFFCCLNAAVRLLFVPVQSPPHGGCELVRVNFFIFLGESPELGPKNSQNGSVNNRLIFRKSIFFFFLSQSPPRTWWISSFRKKLIKGLQSP